MKPKTITLILMTLLCGCLGIAAFVQSKIIETDRFVLALVARPAGTSADEIAKNFPNPDKYNPPFPEWMKYSVGEFGDAKTVFTYLRFYPTLQVIVLFDSHGKLIRVTWQST